LNELSNRQREILAIVVREHVVTAKPVGSDAVCQRSTLHVSPATIRNEFAALTEMGYLTQPHTSAGRLPTAEGYRYFVEQLMQESTLPLEERLLISHQFHQVALDLDEWMKLAAAVLAQAARSAALITAPHAQRARFRYVQLISISELTGLMILVLQEGTVHQQMMLFSRPVAQEQLTRICNKLNEQFANLDTEAARETMHPSEAKQRDELEADVIQRILDLMHDHDTRRTQEIYRDGLVHILREPEFIEVERARQILQVLEHDSALDAILREAQGANGIQVIIGSEGRWNEMRDCSMVLSGYGLPGEAKGVLGVVGPMRMAYGRTIPAVRYIAGVMSDLLYRLYGE
jgi:heat-inducible transcriptional repressor